MVQVNDAVVLHGDWERHAKYGRQLKVSHFTFDQRLDVEGLAQYLANHPLLKGIGPVRAKKIAETFGEDFDRVLDEEPAKVAQVAKLSKETINTLREEWLRTRSVNATLTWLSSFGLTHHQATTLIEKLGNSAVTALRTDPYILVREIAGFGFKRVDEVACKLGTSKEDPNRLRAGVAYCVAERREQGDCWVDYEQLIELGNELLVMDKLDSKDQIEKALDAAIDRGELACVSINGRLLVAEPAVYRYEAELAATFTAQLGSNPHFVGADLAKLTRELASWLTEGQQRALTAVTQSNIVLISGGAGSGKTTLIGAISKLYRSLHKRVVMAAPTGKAAKRMEEVVGGDAFTIHRLLGYDGRQFALGREAPLEADVLIVDEVSMVDVGLAWNLFCAIALDRTAVVLVGDHNQLPPVGPGNLLRDLIEREPIPTVILDQVMRQAGVLKENSIAVLRGEVRKSAEVVAGGRAPWILANRFTEVTAGRAHLNLRKSA
jgi:exodeoxyribonuclease V alpha subunit